VPKFRRLVRSTLALLGVAAALVLAPGAQAGSYSLADLVMAPDDFRISSADGLLLFGHFQATINGALVSDLSQYTVVTDGGVIMDGLQIVGMFGVAGGNAGDVSLQYDVYSTSGPISAASMYFNGRAVGNGALAIISEDFFNMSQALLPEGLTVFATGDGGRTDQLVDDVLFGSPELSMRVVKDIQVISDGGVFASISIIDQHFTVVPEPSSALLVGLGLFGLGLRKRKPLRHSSTG